MAYSQIGQPAALPCGSPARAGASWRRCPGGRDPHQDCRSVALGPDGRTDRADRGRPPPRRERASQRLSVHARQQQPVEHHPALGPRGRHREDARPPQGSRRARQDEARHQGRHSRLVQPLHRRRRRLEPHAHQRQEPLPGPDHGPYSRRTDPGQEACSRFARRAVRSALGTRRFGLDGI